MNALFYTQTKKVKLCGLGYSKLIWLWQYKNITAATVKGYFPTTVSPSGTIPTLYINFSQMQLLAPNPLKKHLFPHTPLKGLNHCAAFTHLSNYYLGWIGAFRSFAWTRRQYVDSLLKGLTQNMIVMGHLQKVYIQYFPLKSTECKSKSLSSAITTNVMAPRAVWVQLHFYRLLLFPFVQIK